MSCTTRVHVIQLMLLTKATDTHFNTIGNDYRRHFGLEYLAQGHFGMVNAGAADQTDFLNDKCPCSLCATSTPLTLSTLKGKKRQLF